ncbi:acireductone synthase [Algiphilus sp.]|uniref:acireductone synthase n=1 Tax=Algiphilus sp. TaxID=1872431 RepID=UPI003B52C92A
MMQAIVTDIEGTTSSIAFVHDTLFPYARERMVEYLRGHWHDAAVRVHVEEVVREAACADTPEAVGAELLRWMDADRKATPLKALQGNIWAEGYADGSLHGHVYPDTPEYLRRWARAGLALYVYSSGSVAAQKLIFGHSLAGDLCPLFSGYFDTTIGGKKESASYQCIVDAVGCPAADILFLSDVGAELDAAAAVGLQTCQLVRDAAVERAVAHPQAEDFAAVDARFQLSA